MFLYILVYIMKKSLLSLVALTFWAGIFCAFANALDISDIFSKDKPLVDTAYTQLLNDFSNEWWYIDNIELICNADQEKNTISIVSPKLEDSKFDTAPWYRLFLSPYRINQIKEWDAAVDNSKIIMIERQAEDSTGNVTFDIPSGDLDANTVYYGFVTPIDMYDEIWTPSKEVCFQLAKNMCMLDQECETLSLVIEPTPAEPEDNWEANEPEETEEDTHGAACVWMNLAHVSHVTNGNKIKLTWTAVDGENVDIAIFNPEQEIYEKLATVKMSDEKYVYTMRWDGEQNFMLTNDCGEVRYKADAKMWSEPEKIVTPATGPAENVLYIAIAAIILYGAYTIFFRKSENN